MAQASLPSDAARPAGMPSTVTSKLQALRNKINMWLLIDGVSRILIVAAGLLCLWFLLDYWFNFDYYLRLVNLAVSCILLGYLAYQYLIVPFATRVSDDALVLAVERHYGRELGESLISAVQFSRMSNEIEIRGASPELVRATIAQGTEAAGKAAFGKVVNGKSLGINIAIFAAAVVLLGIYAYGASAFRDAKFADPKLAENQLHIGSKTYSKQLLGIAFDREVLLKDTPWPQDVYFAFNIPTDGKEMIVPRGDAFSLQVRVTDDSKYTADEIRELRINVISPAGRFSEKLQVVRQTSVESVAGEAPEGDPAGADANTADSDESADDLDSEAELPVDHFLFEMPNVLEEFQFQIEAVGVRGDSDWFNVTLVDRPTVESLTLSARLPKYAGGASEELPAGAGPHHILAGSTLHIAGSANKPLSRVMIHGGEKSQRIDLDGETVFAQDLTFDKEFKSGLISIELWDNEQLLLAGQSAPGPLESKRPTQFSLRVKADRAPDVVAKLDGISGMVTPQVIIPFDCLIKDEFAVTDVQLNYEWKHEENEADAAKDSQAIESAKGQLGQATVRIRNEKFDLAPLEIPVGSGLRLFISAKDNDDINGPNEGQSTVFLLRVVSEAEVREELIRRQAEIRVEFERQYNQQKDLHTETEVLRAASRDAEKLTPQQRQALLELQKNHKLLETNIEGVVRRMEDIAKEMQNNRLDDSESALLQKLQDNVINPMKELAQGDVDKIMQELDNVRSNAERPEERQEALNDAIAQQERNEEKMSEILKNMAKTEGYQEAVNLFYEIVKEQERLEKMTEEERQQLIQDILEGGDKE